MPFALRVVFLAADMARRAILGTFDLRSLLLRDDVVAFRPFLHLINVLLLLVQPIGLSISQLTAGDPLINPLLLVGLPLIDPRGLRPFSGSQAACRDYHRKYHHECLRRRLRL
jgi:hypothetical protein